MSFILDALARQHVSPSPGAARAARRRQARQRLAAAGVAGVLLVVLCAIALYTWRTPAPAPGAVAAAPPAPPLNLAAMDIPTMAPGPSRPASAPEARASHATATATVATNVTAAANTARPVSAARPTPEPRFSPPTALSQPLPPPSPKGLPGAFSAQRPAPEAAPPVASAEPPRAVAVADLKPLSVLTPDLRMALSLMKVRVHFYAPQPRSRFVMIDGRELREGDELLAGLRLEEITDTGMVLRHKDMLVLSPAPISR